jgi:hypothetical protein
MAEILKLSAGTLPLAPKVVEVKPTGATILVEMLSQQELTSGLIKTVHQAEGDKKGTSNQGYIIAFGPSLPTNAGLAIGDRVLVNGPFIPVPVTDGVPDGRVRGLVEYVTVKAILAEPAGIPCCGGGKCDKPTSDVLIGDFPNVDPNAPQYA